MAFALRAELTKMLGTRLPHILFTVSKGLFDILTKECQSTEHRLMIDITSMREAYTSREIGNTRVPRLS